MRFYDTQWINRIIEELEKDCRSLICCQTIIGCGSPNKQGKEECHGAALGDKEVALTRENIGWTHAPFEIPADIYAGWDAKTKGGAAETAWTATFAEYQTAHPVFPDECQCHCPLSE